VGVFGIARSVGVELYLVGRLGLCARLVVSFFGARLDAMMCPGGCWIGEVEGEVEWANERVLLM
jgi:hypothetical protein